MEILNLKIAQRIEVNKKEALQVLNKGFPCIYAEDFKMNFEQKHPLMEDIRYYVEKTKRKGSVLNVNGHPDGGVKADKGVFKVTAVYNFIHPTNNSQSTRDVEQEYKVYI